MNKYKKTDERPIRVYWGGVWVNTVGYPSNRPQCMMGRVYDPHAREWGFVEFALDDWNAGHSTTAWTRTPSGDYTRPGFIMVRQANSALTYALYRSDDGDNLASGPICTGDRQECARHAKK